MKGFKFINKTLFFSLSLVLLSTSMVAAQGFDAAPTVPEDFTNADLLDILVRLIQWVSVALAGLAILTLFYSGYLFMTAGDSQDKQSKAKAWLKWSIIGIVVSIFASAIVPLIADILAGGFF